MAVEQWLRSDRANVARPIRPMGEKNNLQSNKNWQINQADCAKVPEDSSDPEELFSESPAHCYKTEEERDMDAVPSPQIPTMEMTGKSPRRPVVSGASCNAILYQISASNSREQSGDSSTYKLFSKWRNSKTHKTCGGFCNRIQAILMITRWRNTKMRFVNKYKLFLRWRNGKMASRGSSTKYWAIP